jgi:hypothetical protein
MQSRGVIEKPAEGRVIVMLLEGLRRAAQRAQILEHALGIRPPLGARRVVADVLVVGNEPSRQRHHRDHDVTERPSRLELCSDALKARPEALAPDRVASALR